MCGALAESNQAEDGMEPIERTWYCIRSQRKREHFAAAHLRQIPGVEVFNPQLRLVRSTRRGRVWSTESLFPNYLFARFDLEKLLERVRYTPSVKGVVQFGEQVPPIPDFVIEDLRQSLIQDGQQTFTDEPLEGEEAEISAGPFEGERGVVMRVLPAKQRVQVLLQIMGRSISAELNLAALLFKRRNAADFVLSEAEAASGAGVVKQILKGERCRIIGAEVIEADGIDPEAVAPRSAC
jgi:transcriptional antiterminator RfaH